MKIFHGIPFSFYCILNLMIILYNQYDRYKSLKLSKNMLPNRRLPNGNHHHTYYESACALYFCSFIHPKISYKIYTICTYISWGLTRLLVICVTLSLIVTHISCYVYVLQWFEKKPEEKTKYSFVFFFELVKLCF